MRLTNIFQYLTIFAFLCFLNIPSAYSASGGGGGFSGGSFGSSSQSKRTPEQIALGYYESGLKYKNKAWKYEDKEDAAKTEKRRDRQLASAKKQYIKAIGKYNKAIEKSSRVYEAINELGCAYRKIGDFDASLAAYDSALGINPEYTPAIEYRAEAYLALGRLNETKKAYMQLFRDDPELATTLIQAMESWITGKSISCASCHQPQRAFTDGRKMAIGVRPLSLF